MFWVECDVRFLSVQSVSAVGDCEVTDGPEASRHSAEKLSNVTESEEKAQIVTGVEQRWEQDNMKENIPVV